MSTQALFRCEDYVLSNVLKTFDRNEKSLSDDVAVLKEWIDKQPHLPKILDCRMLENFLLLNKFDLEKTKQKVEMYYAVRTKAQDVYNEINPNLPHMQELKDLVYIVPHPKLSNDLCRVFFGKLRNKELVHRLEPINVIRHAVNVQEMRMREDVYYGDIFIIDCQGLASQIHKFSPSLIVKVLLIYGKVFSLRVKAAYVLNLPYIAEKILPIVKAMIKPKIFERVRFCSVSDLQNDLPSDILPPEFGGTGFLLQELQDMLEAKLTENKDLFDHLDTVRIDEQLKPENLKNDEMMGYYGNFKQLDLD